MKIGQSSDQRLVVVYSSMMPLAIAPLPTLLAIVAVLTGLIPPEELRANWRAWLCCFSILQLGLLAFTLPFVQKARFDFDLIRQELTWSRHRLWGKKSGTLPFDQIRYASVDFQCGDGADGAVYRVVLYTTQGMLPLTTCYTGTNRDKHAAIVADINAALQGSRQ